MQGLDTVEVHQVHARLLMVDLQVLEVQVLRSFLLNLDVLIQHQFFQLIDVFVNGLLLSRLRPEVVQSRGCDGFELREREIVAIGNTKLKVVLLFKMLVHFVFKGKSN